MAKKPTIGDILKEGKRQAEKIRKDAIKKTKRLLPPSGVPGLPIGPGIQIGDLASQIALEMVNQASDIAFQDLQNVPLPMKKKAVSSLASVDQSEMTVPKPRSDKQLVNDQIMRVAVKNANTRARKKKWSIKERYDTKENHENGAT